jgi:hypothetical protein
MVPSMDSRGKASATPLVTATVVAVASVLASLGYALHLRRELAFLRLKNGRSSDEGSECASSSSAVVDKAERKNNKNGSASEPMLIYPIGTIRSPFPQRAGTPRQGLLAPHARSILTLKDDMPFDVVDGFKEYSHAWVIFVSII